MIKKSLYKVINKENNETIAIFKDSEDLFYLTEWYQDSGIEYKVEKYELVDEW